MYSNDLCSPIIKFSQMIAETPEDDLSYWKLWEIDIIP